ncbi:MAG: Fic family protein, partial [Armatimonadetes bacterium]|nr:Fic family protein [Armatimonadota bacterium]
MRDLSDRSGRYVNQATGYRAFIPSPLPPDPPLAIDDELLTLLSEADQALARLDAATEFLPNPGLFVLMYARKEAVLSSQIEGTQASLADLLAHEARVARPGDAPDVDEIANYLTAMNQGLARLAELPLSLRLLREMHATLLQGVRGAHRSPGEFRRSQNWIGPPGCTLADASYVPPPPHELDRCLGDLERFLHDERPMPVLLKAALAHVQFETIHPFLDGNGRMGRLLITFFLCWRGILRRPTLYLSSHMKRHRAEYYERLQAVRDGGDHEGWVRFFLQGVREVSADGAETARAVQRLREDHRAVVSRALPGATTGLTLLDHLYQHPYVTVSRVADVIGRTFRIAGKLVSDFERIGLLRETTGHERNRVFAYEPC